MGVRGYALRGSGPPKAVPQWGVWAHTSVASPRIFKFQVLGNAISVILRQSQRVLISHFLKVKIPFFVVKI